MCNLIKSFEKKKLPCIAFYQALGIAIYCGLVGLLFWKGNEWFGKVPNYWGPLLFLILFSASALVCAVIVFGYPFILFWEKEKPREALRLVVYTAGWLVFFTLLVMLGISIF